MVCQDRKSFDETGISCEKYIKMLHIKQQQLNPSDISNATVSSGISISEINNATNFVRKEEIL